MNKLSLTDKQLKWVVEQFYAADIETHVDIDPDHNLSFQLIDWQQKILEELPADFLFDWQKKMRRDYPDDYLDEDLNAVYRPKIYTKKHPF